jgi:hypothetical protein
MGTDNAYMEAQKTEELKQRPNKPLLEQREGIS